MSQLASKHMSPVHTIEHPELLALLTRLSEDLDAIVDQIELLALDDPRAAAHAGDAVYRSCQAAVLRLSGVDARISPSRWFG
jgi:hypothetical protein